MTLTFLLSKTKQFFSGLPKKQLLDSLIKLQEDFKRLSASHEVLKQENADLKNQLQKKKIEEVNKNTNKPSSKQGIQRRRDQKSPHGKEKRGKVPEIEQNNVNPGKQ